MQGNNKMGLGLWSLVCLGISSIIGSGWLFSAYRTAQTTAGGALFAWVIGGFIVLLVALVIAEIATLYPKRGLFGRALAISHNKDMGYVTALANWFGIVATIPTEAMATIQYLSKASPSWNVYFFVNGDLTGLGLGLVSCLILLYALANFWGARLLARSNNIITIFKVVVPIITAVTILLAAFHPGNFTADGGKFLPYGSGSILTAIMTGGIIYAFNGFQTIASFCSEARNPKRDIPLALTIAIFVSLAVYLLLQTAFIGGVPSDMLANGWKGLSFQSPIVELSSLLGLNVISLLLYVDACVSPSGTGIVYVGATGRMLTAMAQEKQAPAFFDNLHPVFNFSRRSLAFNIVLSLILLWFFRSWESLVVVVSMFHTVSYLACPLAMMRLRLTEPHKERPFRLPFAKVICPALFIFVTVLFCLAPVKDLILVTSVLVIFYTMYIFISNQAKLPLMVQAFSRSYNLVLYFVVLTGLGLLGDPNGGSLELISGSAFYILSAAAGLVFYYWLVYGGLPMPHATSETSPAQVSSTILPE
jgi:amino acid transporter